MTRPPPRSPLFPYPPLFRSRLAHRHDCASSAGDGGFGRGIRTRPPGGRRGVTHPAAWVGGARTTHDAAFLAAARSEEHTSELQSQSNIVCRLLLEKKKKKTH